MPTQVEHGWRVLHGKLVWGGCGGGGFCRQGVRDNRIIAALSTIDAATLPQTCAQSAVFRAAARTGKESCAAAMSFGGVSVRIELVGHDTSACSALSLSSGELG